MFVSKKRTKRNPHIYVQLVESYRDLEGKVKQRVIKHIGSAATDEQLEKIEVLANQVKEKLIQGITDVDGFIKQELSKINGCKSLILNCEAVRVQNKGIAEVYGKVFDDMGLDKLIASRSNYAEVLKDIVLGRIMCLGSKRKTAEQLEKRLDKHHTINSIYRTMDKVDDEIVECLQDKISHYNEQLLNGNLRVLFYDVTTIYFESFSDDELRALGYSKDLKFNQPQIVFTMLVTEEGLPLAYQVFPGNTYEGHTLQMALEGWKKRYPSQTITLVADSGMLNSSNLEYLEQAGFDYIVCARLKSFNQSVKSEIIFSKEGHSEDFFHEIKLDNRRLIISYRENRAIKDRHDREQNVAKLSKKIRSGGSPASLISNYGYKKYISVNEGSTVVLDEEKIKESAQWDGLHGLITNMKDVDPEQIYAHYRGLYLIEDAFRINKTDLKIRPVFHWTPHRVKAHIAISYMAFCCYKAVEFQYNKTQSEKLSHRQIREILNETQVAIYKDKYSGETFSIPLPIPKEAYAIYASQNINLTLAAHTLAA